MSSVRGVMSPLAVASHTPVIGQKRSHLSPAVNEFISPSTRRHVALSSLASVTSSMALSPSVLNDDEREKRERRRSKVADLQQRTVSSPATPSDRRLSANLGNLNNNQLADHYANCIKLSAENVSMLLIDKWIHLFSFRQKINAKNAFGLHLIDYMSDLLKKKGMSNFQVASSTLDASAKIYAGRVDAIHTETYKVLSGLGRGQKEQKQGDEDEMMDENEDGVGPTKKAKRAKRSNTIETNLKNINVSKFDLEFEVDPLFHKTSAAFDEGGSGGLLLNHLNCMTDACELTLDSQTVACSGDMITPSQESHDLDLKDIREMVKILQLENRHVCSSFADFEFTNWSQTEDPFASRLQGRSSHAFDLDAEPDPIPALDSQDAFEAAEDMFDGDVEDDDDDAASNVGNSSDQLCAGKEGMLVKSAIQDMTSGTVTDLVSVLASEPSDYSYFDNKMLRAWAGPEHWKLGPKSKESNATAAQMEKKTKEKSVFSIDYEKEEDLDSKLKKTRAATMLTRATLDRYSKSQTTLPEDLHYETEQLTKPFTKPEIMIYCLVDLPEKKKVSVYMSGDCLENAVKRRCSAPDEADDYDDAVGNYDYENANDRDNFCPAVGNDDDDDDGDDLNEQSAGFDFTQVSQDSTQTQDQTLGSLVEQPKKVAKIDIDYAKAAKKMDVKKLKGAMWKKLMEDEIPPKEASPAVRAVKEFGDQEGRLRISPIVLKRPSAATKDSGALLRLDTLYSRNVIKNNMGSQTVVEHRVICDHISSAGGIDKLSLTPATLQSCSGARAKFGMYLDRKMKDKEDEMMREKRKREEEEKVEVAKRGKTFIDDDVIQKLETDVNGHLEKAEASTGSKVMAKLAKASALRRGVKPSNSPCIVAGEHHFSRLMEQLPASLSRTMSDNLSVPIAFVCLLHLANEKKLQIRSDDTMSDLTISQD
ncbi:hypothetical protein CAPTEDRAFT_224498 [Capitella teleta]|uniref:Condensin complex subunit 2 n=1 Tax=Capitella teleta TaxID=283909 RepID=R7U6N8_CAPTE|nr:hypothetical protein CAPTEDRAFT_224498 [Capitella teleta]|eukprot:ELU01811.1 hypothetical protein CAPTEDRAFT_224498 [Capitella teleta]